MGFAVRRAIIARNPVKETSRMKKPKYIPKALTVEQISPGWTVGAPVARSDLDG
jgi:site-specific recombinase XerC